MNHSLRHPVSRAMRWASAAASLALGLAAGRAAAQAIPTFDTFPATLAAGRELSREVGASVVTLEMVSRPYFGVPAADWPTVEIGPASLAFLRNRDSGGMVLLGDQALELPEGVVLGPDGRSAEPLGIVLTYDRARSLTTLAVAGRTYTLPTAAAPGNSLRVAIAAGAHTSWPIQSLRLEEAASAIAPAPDSASSGGTPPGSASTSKAQPLDRMAAASLAQALFSAADPAASERALAKASKHAEGTPARSFDIAAGYVRVALAFSRRGDTANCLAAAREAIAQLGQITKNATSRDGDLIVGALELRGWIEQQLLGDWPAAKASYREAAARGPANGHAAGELDRIEKMERDLALKSRGPGG